jgi:formylglycine-generating enzyme required for sulfatase activity
METIFVWPAITSKKFFLCCLILVATFRIVDSISAQPAANALSVELRGEGVRLHYAAAPDMNGLLFVLQSSKIETLLSAGEVLLSGAPGAALTGLLDLPFPRSSPAFFGLAQFSAGAALTWIPPGRFVMGSSPAEQEGPPLDETQHEVILTNGFFMQIYEVTQEEFLNVMGRNPSAFNDDLTRPVESVGWIEATNYCALISKAERIAGRLPPGWEYRLPTEAEWEYACRAGTSTAFYFGNDLRSDMANFDGRYEYVGGTGTFNNPDGSFLGRTTTVGSYAPNAFGLYDMHGNVAEWSLDWYGSYPNESVTNPRGPSTGPYHVFRGGAWNRNGTFCRSAFRSDYAAGLDRGNKFIGFRAVLVPSR